MKKSPPGATPLTDEEFARLATFLGGIRNGKALTLEGLDGFFCALVAGPDRVLPSEYLPVVWGGELPDENAFESMEDANAIVGLMLQHWNAIVAEYAQFRVYVPLFDPADERGVAGRQWARGFMRGVALRHRGWAELFMDENEGQLLAIPLVAGEIDPGFPTEDVSAEKAEQLVSWMAAGAGRAWQHFSRQRRDTARASRETRTVQRMDPKVGRNEPCPCGSGKKYKQCCGRSGEPGH
jgi:uncharacterized protein